MSETETARASGPNSKGPAGNSELATDEPMLTRHPGSKSAPRNVTKNSMVIRNTKASDVYDVLIVIDHYLPGRLAGGPVTTVSNLTSRLGEQVRFLVVTRMTDLDGAPHSGIANGELHRVLGADVLYLDADCFGPQMFLQLIRKHNIPVLYLNSFFSTTTIRTLWAAKAFPAQLKWVLAPRGEFSPGALRLKGLKKRSYLSVFRLLRLDRRVDVFQASSDLEQREIWQALGPVHVQIAVDLAAPVPDLAREFDVEARAVFLSRISPKKNLLYALDVLRRIKTPLVFDIYGPLEDDKYWLQCQAAIRTLPSNVSVNYKGAVEHEQIHQVLLHYDAMLFPTLGENYGHVIWEALASGCPVITSDQTMWHELEKTGTGYTLPLSAPDAFVQALTHLVGENPEQKRQRAERCVAYARSVSEDARALAESLSLLT